MLICPRCDGVLTPNLERGTTECGCCGFTLELPRNFTPTHSEIDPPCSLRRLAEFGQ